MITLSSQVFLHDYAVRLNEKGITITCNLNDLYFYGTAQKEGSELNFAEDRGFNQGAVSGAQAGEITLPVLFTSTRGRIALLCWEASTLALELQLFSWDHSLRLNLNIPSLPNDPNTFYSHKLEGFEKYWSEPSKVNYARFSMLPTGKYVFVFDRG